MKLESKSQMLLQDVAARIKELREISGLTVDGMAAKTDISPEEYETYESGLWR
jgi:transcriptional regulator with XRE-family HTH domain